jgi:glutamate dehydrogenase
MAWAPALFGEGPLDDNRGKAKAHNRAQLAHAKAPTWVISALLKAIREGEMSGEAVEEPGPATTSDVLVQAFMEALGAAKPTAPSAAIRAFVDQVLEDYRADELPGVTERDLAAVLANFWTWGASPGDPAPAARLIRAAGVNGRDLEIDLLEITQPDAPFLVDSVMGAVTDWGGDVRAMFHPLSAQRDGRRSLIQVWLTPVAEERRAGLIRQVLESLADVHLAVADYPGMLGLLARVTGELVRAGPGDPEALAEDVEFLRWMDAGHFVFLGARIYVYPRTSDGGYAAEEPDFNQADSLGVLRDPERLVLRRSDEPAVLSAALKYRLESARPVLVAKANLRSRVHRRTNMDYFAVRRYSPDGTPMGEVRFVGLFTAHAYLSPARETPLLRHKIRRVMRAAGFPPASHNATRLANILETYPRDELFQISAEELLPTALGVLHLSDRPRFKLFVRRDPFNRFLSILLYAPRDRLDARLRRRAGEILAEAHGGRVTASYPAFSDAPLARVHYILQLPASAGLAEDPDLAKLEADIARAARTWADDLEAAIRAGLPQPGRAAQALATYGGSFPAGYRDRQGANEALVDLLVIDDLARDGRMRVRAFRQTNDSPRCFRFKLYHRGDAPAPLARLLSILESLGLRALAEEGFEITPRVDGEPADAVWIHAFLVEDDRGEHLTFDDVRRPFESAFMAVWQGETENDGFNRLVIELGASWREAALVRALARYRSQAGLDPSQPVQEAAIVAYPGLAALLLRLFAARFDPTTGATLAERATEAQALGAEIETALMSVQSLDHDRVLRRLAALIQAVTRTNYYQTDSTGATKSYISFKIASRTLVDLPAPKPYREIFVASPVVEGVHLRFGPVARGGLRWSDRRDDFRTEVLGLVKAQQVKNAVIVPVGSKGGFYPKRLPRSGGEAFREAAIEAYKTFLCGLLDLTDNLNASGDIDHPPQVVAHDGDDPYLVVAADKGTATFSDVANTVAADYGFWLGDAFASGGSAGYDHKAMGITARGAWESVKRHFRELGKDIQRERFTVVGVGDMSGDVFGNGMLLSKATRLRAAFDHRHIFIDPDPDAEVSWAERKRLFELPTSSWADYDQGLISTGGGIWPRSAKSIAVSPEMRSLLDMTASEVSPAELINAILKSRTELLYLGGIGTYVKSAEESHLSVGDKANDAIRVNGRDLRCRVVGEGANLGFTQAGRIEFALAGGRINTDAIDNSAGVDTSDHEVNIKILTGLAQRAGVLAAPDRNTLLASMTDDIAGHVLRHNYDQTLQLSLLEAYGVTGLDEQARFMATLERHGRLDRALEGLPDEATLAARAKAGKGLVRPELAVLLAYGKLELFDEIIASAAPDDRYFETTLRDYFPGALRRFEDIMPLHRLRREIIATVAANDIVNLCGPTFAARLRASAGCDTSGLVTAFEAARQILRLGQDWARISDLDGAIPAVAQLALYDELARLLRGLTYLFARRQTREMLDVQALADRYRSVADALRTLIPAVLSPFERKQAVRRSSAWIKLGAPKTLAHSIGLMRPLIGAVDVCDVAARVGWPLAHSAYVYCRVGGHFGFDRLRAAAAAHPASDAYERIAARRLIEDTLSRQAALAGVVMAFSGPPIPSSEPSLAASAVNAWAAARAKAVKSARDTVSEIETSAGGWTFAKLTIANAALRDLVDA